MYNNYVLPINIFRTDISREKLNLFMDKYSSKRIEI